MKIRERSKAVYITRKSYKRSHTEQNQKKKQTTKQKLARGRGATEGGIFLSFEQLRVDRKPTENINAHRNRIKQFKSDLHMFHGWMNLIRLYTFRV